jgi:ERCC4-type nuclease
MITAIMVDSREPTWVQELKFGGLPVSVTMLDFGDIWAVTDDGQMLVIERKTPGDFLNTLAAERLFTQLDGLKRQSRYAYLLITGELQRDGNGKVIVDHGVTGWSWAAVQGALLTAQELGVFVIFCAGDMDLEAAVLRLGRRDRKPEMLVPPIRASRVLNVGETVLASLPGIGVEKVGLLLEACESPAWALAALTDNKTGYNEIPGIGPITRQNIRQALGLEDWATLAVIDLNSGNPAITVKEEAQVG